MPELGEQMYCSEQINIPPAFPYLLRQFAKAAIRSQPRDLLKWSTAYFRCLSLNIPPPVKPRLEYPLPKDYCGVTPGWLKALMYQLQNNITVPFKILWDRWTGACLAHNTLIQILCLGGFDKPEAVPWLRFVGLCASLLTEDLTHTMILICEIVTEEPEGGSASITLEAFLDLYRFLATIDASQPQMLRNFYFTDSLLSLLREKEEEAAPEAKEETVSEVESSKSQISEKVEEEEVKKEDSKEIISCPSIGADDNYSMEYYIEATEEADEGGGDLISLQGGTMMELVLPDEFAEEPPALDEEVQEEPEKREGVEGEETAIGEDEETEIRVTGEMEGEGPEDVHEEGAPTGLPSGEELELEPKPYESVDTVQEEPRHILPEVFEDEVTLKEDLERLKVLQQEVPGETDDELEKYKCRLIEEMPLTASQEAAVAKFAEPEPTTEPQAEEEAEAEEEEVVGEGGPEYEEIYCGAVPGIGGKVPEELVKAVCEYMSSVASIQHGMVMPRNVRHYNCPPLEVLHY